MGNRANGRTGMGAVMGSKNLKAVGVPRQGARWPWPIAAAFQQARARGRREIPKQRATWRGHDAARAPPTASLSPECRPAACRRSTTVAGQFDDYEAISGEVMTETILKERDTCYACTIRCKRVVETSGGACRSIRSTAARNTRRSRTFGSYCGVGNLEAVAQGQQDLQRVRPRHHQRRRDDRLCHGVLREGSADRGGHRRARLRFGNAEAMVALTEMIATREGSGRSLAEGSRAAPRKCSARARENTSITVKGAEAPAHMPQAKRSLGLIYAVNPFGADHQSVRARPDDRGGRLRPGPGAPQRSWI